MGNLMSDFKIGDIVEYVGDECDVHGFATVTIVDSKSQMCYVEFSYPKTGIWTAYSELVLVTSEYAEDEKVKLEEQIVMTLPTDSKERKEYPLCSGLLKYFPAALAGVSNISKKGNDKHNPGEPLHHARGKSMDHSDCIVRHLMDTEDLLAARERGLEVTDEQLLTEVNQLAWRALAYAQELHEKLGAPLAPGAKE